MPLSVGERGDINGGPDSERTVTFLQPTGGPRFNLTQVSLQASGAGTQDSWVEGVLDLATALFIFLYRHSHSTEQLGTPLGIV